MPTVIKPKRSETALAVPSAGSLEVGELALNVTDGKFYVKKSDNSVKEVGGAGSVTLNDVVTNGSFTGVYCAISRCKLFSLTIVFSFSFKLFIFSKKFIKPSESFISLTGKHLFFVLSYIISSLQHS